MISIQGKWFDGRTSVQTQAVLNVHDSGAWQLLEASSNNMLFEDAEFSAKVSSKLGNTPRYVYLTEDGTFETPENEAMDHILSMTHRSHWSIWVHALESKMRYVLTAAALIVVFAFLGMKFGVPAAAQVIAARLPSSVLDTAGEQVLNFFDKAIFKPSEISKEKAQQVFAHLQPVINQHQNLKLKIMLRKGGKIGPNAFALPNGYIIFTDELINMAKHDDELLGIMVHEIGHVVHQHGMRRLIQDSILSFAIMAVTGDASGVSEIFLGLPVVLTELSYSRKFETEADQYALDYMLSKQIPPHRFGNILKRINEMDKKRQKQEGNRPGWTSYLSTHPDTQKRIKLFHNASTP